MSSSFLVLPAGLLFAVACAMPPALIGQSTGDDASQAVAQAVAAARRSQRHVLMNFGAEWCLECRLLERTLAEPAIAAVLDANFIVVPVHVGRMVGQNYAEQNIDLVRKYGLFKSKEDTGIPYVVVLDSEGRVVARTASGEWRTATGVAADNVLKDLKRWAPSRKR